MSKIILIMLALSILILMVLLIPEEIEKEVINYVFINKKTKKFHQEQCPYSKDLEPMTLEEAIKEEYIPCKICNEKNA